jgi:hypothetical protein
MSGAHAHSSQPWSNKSFVLQGFEYYSLNQLLATVAPSTMCVSFEHSTLSELMSVYTLSTGVGRAMKAHQDLGGACWYIGA